MTQRFALPLLVACLVFASTAGLRADQVDALFASLRDGAAVAIMRHALAPGTGDPADFTLGDCTTQRNLSDEGRAQAAAIGARLRAQGIEAARVFSSRWCRCLETARLLGLGEVEPLPPLDSFFRDRARGPAQTEALREFLSRLPAGPPVVLVSHQVNITALTGVYPQSGEIVLVRPDGVAETAVLGTIEPE